MAMFRVVISLFSTEYRYVVDLEPHEEHALRARLLALRAKRDIMGTSIEGLWVDPGDKERMFATLDRYEAS